MTFIGPLFALVVGALFVRKVYKLRGLIADYQVRLDTATAELETANISYKALLARANGLAEDRAKANALVNHVETYLGKMGTEVQELLNRHLLARRALERIVAYNLDVTDKDTIEVLKDIAQKAIDQLGLTMTGTVEVLAQRMVPTGEEAETTVVQLLDAAGGVASVNGNRPMKPIDLSGQAARIREQLKATSSRLHIVVEGAKPGQCRGGGPEESPGVDVVREYPKQDVDATSTPNQPE